MCTTAMKTQIDSQISNEHFLPFSLNNQVKSLQRKLCWLPPSASEYCCGQSSKIKSLKRYKQTKWIHHHHRQQTVLSRKSLSLPVGFFFKFFLITVSISNLWLNSTITFIDRYQFYFIHRNLTPNHNNRNEICNKSATNLISSIYP